MTNKKHISRRDFFKLTGAAGMAIAGWTACNRSAQQAASGETTKEIPTDQMTYRKREKRFLF